MDSQPNQKLSKKTEFVSQQTDSDLKDEASHKTFLEQFQGYELSESDKKRISSSLGSTSSRDSFIQSRTSSADSLNSTVATLRKNIVG